MNKMKKILIIVLALFMVLPIVELIDNKKNGEMYINIDNFYNSVNEINHSPEATICAKQSIYTSTKNTNEAIVNAKNTCKYTLEKINRLEVPTQLPQKRKKILEEIKNDTISMYQNCYKMVKLQEKYKNNIDELKSAEKPYFYDNMRKGYYLPIKISNAKVRNNFKSRFKNLKGKFYMTLTKNTYEKNLKILYGKEN